MKPSNRSPIDISSATKRPEPRAQRSARANTTPDPGPRNPDPGQIPANLNQCP